ncbi:MAG: hypothetical protein SFU53_01240, partial [Terrimicrobiaceae bacterium]|nr:hypothetical protein [Terrimicrobiaceae bacterium]
MTIDIKRLLLFVGCVPIFSYLFAVSALLGLLARSSVLLFGSLLIYFAGPIYLLDLIGVATYPSMNRSSFVPSLTAQGISFSIAFWTLLGIPVWLFFQ